LPAPGAPRWLLRRAPTLVGAALILLMSVSLAWQTADWLRLLRTPPQVAAVDTQTALAPPTLERLEPLFGPASSAGDAPPPATSLRLTLLGSFVHVDPSRSSAIIQREGSKPRRYGIGDELDNGIYLHAVYRDRVELKRQGRLESLPFPAKRISGISSSEAETPAGSALEQLSELHNEDAALLRERMDALRQQMEAAGSLPAAEPPEPPMESD